MNKSILIVVCDFLVLSLLSFVSFDTATADEGDTISKAALEEAKNQSQSEVGMLFEILNKKNEEQKRENEEQEDKLKAEKEALEKTLSEKEQNLDQSNAELEKTRENLENTEELAANLEKKKTELEKERANLQQEKSNLKEERDILTGQTKEAAETRTILLSEVKDLESKKAVVGERLKNMQNEVEKKKAELSQQQKDLARLDTQKAEVIQEKQNLQVALAQKDATLTSTQTVLAKTEGNLATAQQNIQNLQGDKVQLQGNLAQSEAEKTVIAQQKATLEKETTELEKKSQTLVASKTLLEKEKTGLQDEKRELQTSLEKSRLQIEAAKNEEERIRQSIARQREAAKAELARYEQEKARLLDEKEALDKKNTQLTENFANLDNKIEKIQPQSHNTIFTTYGNAQVRLRFLAVTKGLLGSTQTREFKVPATLLEDNQGIYAVTLTKDTPFESRRIRASTGISGTINAGNRNFDIPEVGYSKADPRVLIIPIPSEAAEGFQRFRIDPDPYRFPKAILVDPNSQGYGEMGFNIHADNNHYIQLKSGILRSLSGDFTQSTGDLAFSQTGHFLGVLINRNHAILIPDLSYPFKVALGNGFSSERTSLISNIVDGRIRRLNAELN